MAGLRQVPEAATVESQTTAAEQKPQNTKMTDDEWQLLAAKVEEHQQTKVESVSKFRLKLSGMFLLKRFRELRFC